MTKQKVNQDIIKQLYSTNEDQVIKSITHIRENGFKDYIEPLCELYIQNTNSNIRKKVSELISDIKESSIKDIVIDILTNTSSNELRMMLLTSCWSSRNDYSNYLKTFVDIAIKHDYLETLESLTIIENFENMPLENDIDESISILKSEIINDKTGKQQLLYELIKILEDYKKSYLE